MKRIVSLFTVMALLVVATPVVAQSLPEPGSLGAQNLRGYTHMFIAYAIAWALVLGWVISIARRLKRLEGALED